MTSSDRLVLRKRTHTLYLTVMGVVLVSSFILALACGGPASGVVGVALLGWGVLVAARIRGTRVRIELDDVGICEINASSYTKIAWSEVASYHYEAGAMSGQVRVEPANTGLVHGKLIVTARYG